MNLDRLRDVVGGLAPRAPVPVPDTPAVLRGLDPAVVLDGEWSESNGQGYVVADRRYLPGQRLGRVTVADCLPPADGWAHLELLAGKACGPRLLFLDVETTGLAGGAGTYAFLVGCGWFDGGVFRIRQYFLASYGGERALLGALTEACGTFDAFVTYNGKSFDLPLIETRLQLHRMQTSLAGTPHIDMLHHARRLWRPDDEDAESGCSLGAMERTLLGHAREHDVAGFEIPARYFHYVRSGDARPLQTVLEHNRLDLLALAMVTARVARLLDDGAEAAETAREALGLGCLYERGGMSPRAYACYTRAAGMGADLHTRAQALRCQAILCRRERRYGDAAEAWRQVLALAACPSAIAGEALEALAVHQEHRVRDLQSAQHLARQSLTLPASPSRARARQHRLARLGRKLGQPAAEGSPLF